MAQENESRGTWQDGAGYVGIAFALGAMWDLPLNPRLFCILGATVCFVVSFVGQPNWPHWVKLLLSFSVIGLAASFGALLLKHL